MIPSNWQLVASLKGVGHRRHTRPNAIIEETGKANHMIWHGVGYMMRPSSLEVGAKIFLGRGEGIETRVQTALQIEIAHASMAGHEGRA